MRRHPGTAQPAAGERQAAVRLLRACSRPCSVCAHRSGCVHAHAAAAALCVHTCRCCFVRAHTAAAALCMHTQPLLPCACINTGHQQHRKIHSTMCLQVPDQDTGGAGGQVGRQVSGRRVNRRAATHGHAGRGAARARVQARMPGARGVALHHAPAEGVRVWALCVCACGQMQCMRAAFIMHSLAR